MSSFGMSTGNLVLLKKNTRSAIAKLRGRIKQLPVGSSSAFYPIF